MADQGGRESRAGAGAPECGLVLSVRGRRAVVMMPGGEVHRVKVPAAGVMPGDELCFSPGALVGPSRRSSFHPFGLVAAVALVALVFAIGLAVVPLPAVAHVSVGINPCFTVAVDRLLRVVDVVDCDETASELLEGVDLRTMTLAEAVERLARLAAEVLPADQEYWLVLGASPTSGKEGADASLAGWIMPRLEQVQTQAQKAWGIARGQGGTPLRGTVVPVPAAVAAAAHDLGLGAGQYTLMLAAEAAGIDLGQLDSMNTAAVVAAIKDAGQVPGEVFRRADNAASVAKLFEEQGEKVKEATDKVNQGKPPIEVPGKEGKPGRP